MRIAVLEDDPHQLMHAVQALDRHLAIADEDISTIPFESGEALRRALRTETFDALILDWGVPDLDGIDLLRWLRWIKQDDVPVLMLTSRGAERDVAEALGLGADDYVAKPFRAIELCARVRRLLTRRLAGPAGSASAAPIISTERFGPWVFDRSTLSVTIDTTAQTFVLTDREFKLVLALFRHLGRPVSRTYLLESSGHRGDAVSSRALDSHIYRLRNKLGLHAGNGVRLQTVYGQGYRLEWADESADHAPLAHAG